MVGFRATCSIPAMLFALLLAASCSDAVDGSGSPSNDDGSASLDAAPGDAASGDATAGASDSVSPGDSATPPSDAGDGLPDGTAPVDTGSTEADTPVPPTDTTTNPDPTNACNGGCGTGTVKGVVCAPNEQVFVNGAKVWVDATGCDGAPIHIEVTSDAKGKYLLEGVPCGYQTVNVQKGSFEHTFKVPVKVDDETDVTAAGYKQCFKATGVNIAVITGDWDDIENFIGQLGFDYTTYELYGYGWDDQDYASGEAIELLLDPSELAKYDVLFVDCGGAHYDIVTQYPAAVSNIRQFVENGGSLYLSDFAYVYAEWAWPWAVDFMGDDAKGSMGQSGGPIQMSGNQGVPGHVLDASLASYLGGYYIAVQYGLGPLVAMSADPQPESTAVHVEAYVEQFGQTLPLVVSFVPKPGAGRVAYTTFHNDEQATGQMLVTLNYLVFTL